MNRRSIEKVLNKHFAEEEIKGELHQIIYKDHSKELINDLFSLYGVGCSLPSRETMSFEYKTLTQLSNESGLPIDERSMKSGYEYCYAVIKKLQENK